MLVKIIGEPNKSSRYAHIGRVQVAKRLDGHVEDLGIIVDIKLETETVVGTILDCKHCEVLTVHVFKKIVYGDTALFECTLCHKVKLESCNLQ